MDKTIYIKAMCDFNACYFKNTDNCQKCKEKDIDNLCKEGYADYEGKVLLVGPDLAKED